VCHVDVRVSDGIQDVGGIGFGKFVRLIVFCMLAIKFRLLKGARRLYFIPAPAKLSAVLRDLVAMSLLRPFFPALVLHWHAVGLGLWAEGQRPTPLLPRRLAAVENALRWAIRHLLSGADLSIVLAPGNVGDALVFSPKRVDVVPNGIPDPCPDFEKRVACRRERVAQIRKLLSGPGREGELNILFFGQLTKAKGLFTALSGIEEVAAARPDIHIHLHLAGDFLSNSEKQHASTLVQKLCTGGVIVEETGFLDPEAKANALARADILLFPSENESFGLVAVEALAWGLPVIASCIPGIDAVLGDTPCARIPVGDHRALSRALLNPESYPEPSSLREHYQRKFTSDLFQRRMREILL